MLGGTQKERQRLTPHVQHSAVEGDAGLTESLADVLPRILLPQRLQPQDSVLGAGWERRYCLLTCPEKPPASAP